MFGEKPKGTKKKTAKASRPKAKPAPAAEKPSAPPQPLAIAWTTGEPAATPPKTPPVRNEVCELDGHRSVEINDNGQPGQVFLCERCRSVRRVLFGKDNGQVTVIELPAARVLSPPDA